MLFSISLQKLGTFLIFSIFLSCTIIFVSFTFSISQPSTEKLSAYECGFEPYNDARAVFDVRFYLVAILFIIFDLEAIYFFPWAVSISCLNPEGIFLFWDFIIELLVGFYYVWKLGGLEWK